MEEKRKQMRLMTLKETIDEALQRGRYEIAIAALEAFCAELKFNLERVMQRLGIKYIEFGVEDSGDRE